MSLGLRVLGPLGRVHLQERERSPSGGVHRNDVRNSRCRALGFWGLKGGGCRVSLRYSV